VIRRLPNEAAAGSLPALVGGLPSAVDLSLPSIDEILGRIEEYFDAIATGSIPKNTTPKLIYAELDSCEVMSTVP